MFRNLLYPMQYDRYYMYVHQDMLKNLSPIGSLFALLWWWICLNEGFGFALVIANNVIILLWTTDESRWSHGVVGYHCGFWFRQPGFESRWDLIYFVLREQAGTLVVFAFLVQLLFPSNRLERHTFNHFNFGSIHHDFSVWFEFHYGIVIYHNIVYKQWRD